VICAGIALVGTAPAHAQFFFAGNFAFSCGPVNQPLGPVHLSENGPLRWLVPSMTTTVLAETDTNGLRKVQHALALRMMHPTTGNRVWLRNLSVKSAGVAQVIPMVPGWQFGTFFQGESTEAPFYPFPGECLGLGTAKHGSDTYVVVAMGIQATSGTETQGEDLTHLNFWVLNKNSGAVVNVLRARPKGGRYLLSASGFYDIDADGDAEIVLAYGIYFGNDRTDFIYEYYDLLTGTLEAKSRNNQINREIVQ
jgi:hypothetical protein